MCSVLDNSLSPYIDPGINDSYMHYHVYIETSILLRIFHGNMDFCNLSKQSHQWHAFCQSITVCSPHKIMVT